MKKIKREENNRGITLIALIVTVLVLIIIAGIGVSSGIESTNSIKIKKFNDELQLIQSRVDVIYSQIQSGERTETYSVELKDKYIGGELYEDRQSIMDRTFDEVGVTEGRDNFRYYTSKALEDYLQIEDIDQSVLINWKTREVISVEGIKINGVRYYRYEGLYKPNYVQEPSKEIAINASYEINGDIRRVTVTAKATDDDQEISDFTLKYKLKSETVWNIAQYHYFETAKQGVYEVEVSGKGINSVTQEVDIRENLFERFTITNFEKIENGYIVSEYANNTKITPEQFLEVIGLKEGDTITTTRNFQVIQGTVDKWVGNITFINKISGGTNIHLVSSKNASGTITIPEGFNSDNYLPLIFYGAKEGDVKEVHFTDIVIKKD